MADGVTVCACAGGDVLWQALVMDADDKLRGVELDLSTTVSARPRLARPLRISPMNWSGLPYRDVDSALQFDDEGRTAATNPKIPPTTKPTTAAKSALT